MPSMMLTEWEPGAVPNTHGEKSRGFVRWSDIGVPAVQVVPGTRYDQDSRRGVETGEWAVLWANIGCGNVFATADLAMAAADKRLRQMGYVLAGDNDGVDRLLLDTMVELAKARPFRDAPVDQCFRFWAGAIRVEAEWLIKFSKMTPALLTAAAKDGAK